jgi:hypothetical protein
MLTPGSANINVTFVAGSFGSGGIRSDGRQVIDSDNPPAEAFPQGVIPDDKGAGSPFGIGPQSEAYTKRSRVVVNPARKGETEK